MDRPKIINKSYEKVNYTVWYLLALLNIYDNMKKMPCYKVFFNEES